MQKTYQCRGDGMLHQICRIGGPVRWHTNHSPFLIQSRRNHHAKRRMDVWCETDEVVEHRSDFGGHRGRIISLQDRNSVVE